MKPTAVVVGAGLIGTTTAWFLAQRDFDVTVVERRDGPGLETSFANGGLLTPSEADPWNAPGTFSHLLRWMGREDSPLLLRPRALPGMWRWGWKFLRASRPGPHQHATEAILRLALYSLRVLDELEHQVPLEYGRLSNGTLKIFREPRALHATQQLADRLRPLGLASSMLTPDAAVKLEPMLTDVGRDLAGAIHYPQDASGDAYSFTQCMYRHAVAAGVKFHFNIAATRFEVDDHRVRTLVTSEGELIADQYVLAAGSYSPQLMQPLKLRLPIYPVKGYSVTLKPTSGPRLRIPLVDFEQKIVITPLGERLRIAGTAEFNSYDTAPNPTRSAASLRQALRLLPKLAEDAAGEGAETHWNGLRPMTCDGPPILGATPYANLYLNTGHGPLGWTLCAGSARLVADIVAGKQPAVNPEDYSFYRFNS